MHNRTRTSILALFTVLTVSATAAHREQEQDERGEQGVPVGAQRSLQLEYLEIVTPEVDATCDALAALHGAEFGEPVEALGGARTAPLAGGGRLGVRAPMRADEAPVVRPYVRVDDLAAAVRSAAETGGEVALPSMALPDEGTIAIYLQGGIEHGLWQR